MLIGCVVGALVRGFTATIEALDLRGRHFCDRVCTIGPIACVPNKRNRVPATEKVAREWWTLLTEHETLEIWRTERIFQGFELAHQFDEKWTKMPEKWTKIPEQWTKCHSEMVSMQFSKRYGCMAAINLVAFSMDDPADTLFFVPR